MAAATINTTDPDQLHGAAFAVLAAALDLERAFRARSMPKTMLDDFRWTVECLERAVTEARESGVFGEGDEFAAQLFKLFAPDDD